MNFPRWMRAAQRLICWKNFRRACTRGEGWLQARTHDVHQEPRQIAGLLYLFMSIPGILRHDLCSQQVIVEGNATATANNIAAFETLFRLGIAA